MWQIPKVYSLQTFFHRQKICQVWTNLSQEFRERNIFPFGWNYMHFKIQLIMPWISIRNDICIDWNRRTCWIWNQSKFDSYFITSKFVDCNCNQSLLTLSSILTFLACFIQRNEFFFQVLRQFYLLNMNVEFN